jgi:hypothetical protein
VIREPKEEEEGGSYANRMVITRGISPPSFPQIIERERESDQPVLYSTHSARATLSGCCCLVFGWLLPTRWRFSYILFSFLHSFNYLKNPYKRNNIKEENIKELE